MRRIFFTLLCTALSLNMYACNNKSGKSGKNESDSKPLAPTAKKAAKDAALESVPAETPYFLSISLKDLPAKSVDQVRDIFKQNSELSGELNKSMKSSQPEQRFAATIVDAIIKNFTNKTMSQMGVSETPRLLAYGLGFWPVITIELSDSQAFEKWLATTEATAKIKVKTETLGTSKYRVFPVDNKVISVFAVNKNTASFAVVPTELKTKMLPYILGTQKPAKSIQSENVIGKIQSKHGFVTRNAGFANLLEIFKTLASQGEGLNKELIIEEMRRDFKLDAVCVNEFKALIAQGPRFVMGLDKITSKSSSARFVWEMSSGIAADFASVASKTAGTANKNALLNIGIAFDSGKALALFQKKAQELSQSPFKCSELADLNKEVAKANSQLMFIPPFARAFKGVELTVSKLSGTMATMDVAATLVLTVDKAPMVFDALKGMLPPLAALPKLPTDATPVPLNQFPLPPVIKAPHLALGPNAFGLSIGAGQSENLKTIVGAKKLKDSSLLSVHYDLDGVISALKAAGAANPQMKKAVEELTKMGINGSSKSDIRFTKKGLELSSQQTLKP